MLEINGIRRFYFIPQFHDMRCKHDRVLSIIREQFLREPEQDEVFIFMSKDRRKIRLFNYDRRSASFYEKKLSPHYKFMKVEWKDGKPSYHMDWRDVVMLLESTIINKLIIN